MNLVKSCQNKKMQGALAEQVSDPMGRVFIFFGPFFGQSTPFWSIFMPTKFQPSIMGSTMILDSHILVESSK